MFTIVYVLQYPGKKGKNIEDFPEVPAYCRVMIWFGLEEDQMDWTKRDDVEGDFSVFAETVSSVDYDTNQAISVWLLVFVGKTKFNIDNG